MNYKIPDILSVIALLGAIMMTTTSHALPESAPVFPPITVTALILDDGVHTHQYMGNVDAGIPATLSIPLYFISEENTRTVEIPFGNLSSPFSYVGPRELIFFRSPPSPDPEVPLPPEAGRVVLPQAASDVILILITKNFDAREFRIMALDDSTEKFPPNSARVYNFSSTAIAFQFGDVRLPIAQGHLEWLQVDPAEPFQRVRFARMDDNGQWLLAYNRYTRVRNGHRMMYLIVDAPSATANQIMVRRIQEPVHLRHHNTPAPVP